ncbi:MAG: EAL domain-containing protein [Cognaticolwellia sp.]
MLSILRLLFFTSIIVFCSVSLPVNAKLNNVILERLTVEDGLSQAGVISIAQDKQGYIWFGTENGINIYDGYTISSLAGPDNDFHKFNVNHIYVANDGLIWMSIYGKGLYTFDPTSNQYHLILKSGPNDGEFDIWRISEDSKNNSFWLITEKSALRYDLASHSVVQRINFSARFSSIDTIYSVAVLNDRVLFSTRVGLFFYDYESQKLIKLPKVKHSASAGNSFDEFEAGKVYGTTFVDGRYYVGTNDGVFSFAEQSLKAFLQGQSSDLSYQVAIENVSIWQLLVVKEIVYAATTEGLYRVNSDTQHSEFLFKFGENFKSVADANIVSLLADHNGQLWLGSESSGVYRWDPKTEIITTYTYEHLEVNSLSHGNVTSIVPAGKNQLWIGTDDGLNLVDVEKNSIKRFLEDSDKKTSFTRSNIYEIEKDFLGRLWLSTAKGVLLFDENKLIQTDFPESTKTFLKRVNDRITIQSLGEYIWLVSNHGIYKIHAGTGEMHKLNDLPEYFNGDYVWHLMQSFSDDPNDILISGTDTLWQYNQLTKKLTKVYKHEDLSEGGYSYVDNWVRDSKGLIWLSYLQVGLLAINPDDYKVQYFFNEHNSILDVNIYGVQVDSADNIWVSSDKGIFRVRVADKHIRRFNKLDGLASSEFNAGAFYKLDDGRFSYGGISGVSLFDPIVLDSRNKEDSHKVSIVNVDTLSRALNLEHIFPNNEQINLAYDDFGIRIEFSDFAFGHNENPVFKYGFVNGVSFPETQQNFVTFPRLDSGEYTFKVQVKSVITGEYSKPAVIRINVAYAPWRSPLAYSFYTLAIIIAVALWFRTRQLRQNALRIMANYDHLTGLPNRTMLLGRIEHAIASSRRKKGLIAIFFIDLDRFKQVNDSLGHECGDLLLKEVSTRLTMSLRAEDTLARIGGDEFVVLLENFSNANVLAGIAQKLIDLVQQPFALNNNVVSIGASIGISLYPEDAEDSEDLFRNADVAMYHAKQLGRNNYQFFTEHMNKEAKERLAKETNLKFAFIHDEFFNVYQPIIDAYEGKAVGAELLMRWSHNNEVIPPIEFITLAEELGLIIPMTEQAMTRGFKQLQLWRQERPDFYLSVNFSVKHFSDKNLILSIKEKLKKFDLPANALKIEITESAFIVEPEKAIKTMQELSAMGVLLALDDFGTGFSSLAYLKQLPLDIIKIDRSFVDGIGTEKTDEAIIEATLVLAKSLGMYCVAEGVETAEQLHYLVDRQCYYIQGYLYSKPLLADEFIANLRTEAHEIKVVRPRSDST